MPVARRHEEMSSTRFRPCLRIGKSRRIEIVQVDPDLEPVGESLYNDVGLIEALRLAHLDLGFDHER